jgi:hypothetical protein
MGVSDAWRINLILMKKHNRTFLSFNPADYVSICQFIVSKELNERKGLLAARPCSCGYFMEVKIFENTMGIWII